MPAVPTSDRARQQEIQRRQAQLLPDLLHDPVFALESPYWDTWFCNEHDARRRTAFLSVRPPPPRRRSAPPAPPPMWVKEEEQQEPDPDEEEEDDPELKQAMAASLVTHATKEARMCLGLHIVLRRSAREVQHPPPKSCNCHLWRSIKI